MGAVAPEEFIDTLGFPFGEGFEQTVKKAGLLRKRLLLEEKLAKIGTSEPIFD